MTPHRLLRTGIIPALTELTVLGIPDTFAARRLLVAIALQESGTRHRRQVTSGGIENGPASGFWQFEKGGGCAGVLRHEAVADKMHKICTDFNVEATPAGVWEAMRYNDIVAAGAARLLIYTLPAKLPETAMGAWQQYIAAWRPGKPHPEPWYAHWLMAGRIVEEVG